MSHCSYESSPKPEADSFPNSVSMGPNFFATGDAEFVFGGPKPTTYLPGRDSSVRPARRHETSPAPAAGRTSCEALFVNCRQQPLPERVGTLIEATVTSPKQSVLKNLPSGSIVNAQ